MKFKIFILFFGISIGISGCSDPQPSQSTEKEYCACNSVDATNAINFGWDLSFGLNQIKGDSILHTNIYRRGKDKIQVRVYCGGCDTLDADLPRLSELFSTGYFSNAGNATVYSEITINDSITGYVANKEDSYECIIPKISDKQFWVQVKSEKVSKETKELLETGVHTLWLKKIDTE